MTESVANPVVAQATDTAVKQAAIPQNMTGAEAVAWVKAQKEKSLPTPGQNAGQKTNPIPAQKSDPAKETAAEAMRKYKLKVDGKEVEVDENELKRGYAHQQAANKIFQEGKYARKQAEEFVAMMKDPKSFFETARKLGHDPRELAEKYLAAQLEEEMMDPKDREIKQLRTEKEQREFEKSQQKKIEDAKVAEVLKAKYAKEYSDQFIGALQASGLPATKNMVARMASYIGRAAKIGFQMNADEAAKLVREDITNENKSIIGESDGETLMRLLGDSVANKVRKYDTGRLKNPESNLRTPEAQEGTKTRGFKHKRLTPKEWREYNRKA